MFWLNIQIDYEKDIFEDYNANTLSLLNILNYLYSGENEIEGVEISTRGTEAAILDFSNQGFGPGE